MGRGYNFATCMEGSLVSQMYFKVIIGVMIGYLKNTWSTGHIKWEKIFVPTKDFVNLSSVEVLWLTQCLVGATISSKCKLVHVKYKLKMFKFWNCCSSCLVQGGEWLWWRRGIIKYWGGRWFSYETARTYSRPLNKRETFESGKYVIESHSHLIPTHILVLFAESEGADVHAQWRYHGRRVETRTAGVGGQSYACHHDCHQGSCICCKLTVYFFFSLVIFICI